MSIGILVFKPLHKMADKFNLWDKFVVLISSGTRRLDIAFLISYPRHTLSKTNCATVLKKKKTVVNCIKRRLWRVFLGHFVVSQWENTRTTANEYWFMDFRIEIIGRPDRHFVTVIDDLRTIIVRFYLSSHFSHSYREGKKRKKTWAVHQIRIVTRCIELSCLSKLKKNCNMEELHLIQTRLHILLVVRFLSRNVFPDLSGSFHWTSDVSNFQVLDVSCRAWEPFFMFAPTRYDIFISFLLHDCRCPRCLLSINLVLNVRTQNPMCAGELWHLSVKMVSSSVADTIALLIPVNDC